VTSNHISHVLSVYGTPTPPPQRRHTDVRKDAINAFVGSRKTTAINNNNNNNNKDEVRTFNDATNEIIVLRNGTVVSHLGFTKWSVTYWTTLFSTDCCCRCCCGLSRRCPPCIRRFFRSLYLAAAVSTDALCTWNGKYPLRHPRATLTIVFHSIVLFNHHVPIVSSIVDNDAILLYVGFAVAVGTCRLEVYVYIVLKCYEKIKIKIKKVPSSKWTITTLTLRGVDGRTEQIMNNMTYPHPPAFHHPVGATVADRTKVLPTHWQPCPRFIIYRK